ncbi:hypothetical protein MOQ_001922 [Trypanosoma cruzi marinkellei]|uniref:Uncharacterized protein n=1 Tax=Trypanosoma cruzi marinkellei TaxID=85056 RepID=K2P9U8_TRYCR|nr:hypothetical protein MOQ_001922 [Trypanosoma cruzi marinkellei]
MCCLLCLFFGFITNEDNTWGRNAFMAHESDSFPSCPVTDISVLLDGSKARGQHAAAMVAMNQYYTMLYNGLLSLSFGLGLRFDPFLDDEVAENDEGTFLRCSGMGSICSHDGNTVLRVRYEEECRQLEAQRSFLAAALEKKRLECEKLRAKGRAFRMEVEHILPPTLSVNRKVRLSVPSDGEKLLLSMRTAEAPTAPLPAKPTAAAFTNTPLLTMAAAIAAVEDQIRLQEQEVLRNGKRFSIKGTQHLVLQALREDLQDAQAALRRDVRFLEAAKIDALEAEEEKSRLILELEMVTWAQNCGEILCKEISERSKVLTQRVAKVQRMHQALQRVLAAGVQVTGSTSPIADVKHNVTKEEEEEEEEEGSSLENLQDAVRQLCTVKESLFALNNCVVDLVDDVEEIETVVNELKTCSNALSSSTGTHLKVPTWRSRILQEIYNDAVLELLSWQARERLTVTAAAKLLKQLRRLCIVNNIFSTHFEALAGAVMDSGTLWREVQQMLPAAQTALSIVRNRNC